MPVPPQNTTYVGSASAGAEALAQKPDEKVVDRNTPEVPEAERVFVKEWQEKIDSGKVYWGPVFRQMKSSSKFTAGKQWHDQAEEDDRYVANITLRHVNQRVASIYAKNPRVRAVRSPRLYLEVWDGSPQMLLDAKNTLMSMQDPQGYMAALHTGQIKPAAMAPEQAQAVMQDAIKATQQKQLFDRLGKTLEIVTHKSLDEPTPRFKVQAKQLVRRVLTCKVGYVKVGYQREMGYSPDCAASIKDVTEKLEQIKRLTADAADGEILPQEAEAEELRQSLKTLHEKKELLVREGVTYSFPKAWNIIPDHENTTQLCGFVGSEWIVEQYFFPPKKVQKIYGIDVGSNFTQHNVEGGKADRRSKAQSFCAVYEVHDLVNQQVFTICEGYPGYIKAPANEDIEIGQVHPYFALTFNDVESTNDKALESIYPPADAELLQPMAREYNRAREGLRVHRVANRPAHVAAKGVFSDEDKEKLATHADHELIELGIGKQDDVKRVLGPKPTVPIEKDLYEVEHVFIDVQRVIGDQAANLGGTSGSTATESSIAENSRVSTLQSNIDDLDEFFTDVMRATGEILLLNMSKEMVVRIAGPGAAWPELGRKDVIDQLYLEIRAGSSGRPNRQVRLQTIEKTMPLLLQVPGIKPRKIAEFVLNEVDDGLDIDDFLDDSLPSITSMNANAQPNLAPMPGNSAQGPAGKMNAPSPEESAAKTQNLGGGPAPAPAPGSVRPPPVQSTS